MASRKAEGLTWAPVRVVRTAFTLGGRPTVEVVADSGEPGAFRSGSAVQLTSDDNKGERVSHRGIVRSARGLEAEVVLDGEDLPEQALHRTWTLDARFDERSFKEMARALSDVLNAGHDGKPSRLAALREVILGYARPEPVAPEPFEHPELNASQNRAVAHFVGCGNHDASWPSGNRRTTTLAWRQFFWDKEKVMCATPSNAAADLLVERLGQLGLNVVRIGHPMRVDLAWPTGPSTVWWRQTRTTSRSRPTGVKPKRQRGPRKEVRTSTGPKVRTCAAFAEARQLRKEADRLEVFSPSGPWSRPMWWLHAGGAADRMLRGRRFGTVVLDEAGQALEPEPDSHSDGGTGGAGRRRPSVAADGQGPRRIEGGVGRQLVGKGHRPGPNAHLLDTQYRMHEDIMLHPNRAFYSGALQAAPDVAQRVLDGLPPLTFVDTAGRGWDEERAAPEADVTGRSHASIRNPEEAAFVVDRVRELLSSHPMASIGVIAPYRAQVTLLEELLIQDAHNPKGAVHSDCGRIPRARAGHHGDWPDPFQCGWRGRVPGRTPAHERGDDPGSDAPAGGRRQRHAGH